MRGEAVREDDKMIRKKGDESAREGEDIAAREYSFWGEHFLTIISLDG